MLLNEMSDQVHVPNCADCYGYNILTNFLLKSIGRPSYNLLISPFYFESHILLTKPLILSPDIYTGGTVFITHVANTIQSMEPKPMFDSTLKYEDSGDFYYVLGITKPIYDIKVFENDLTVPYPNFILNIK
jgi:hypothetical protein